MAALAEELADEPSVVERRLARLRVPAGAVGSARSKLAILAVFLVFFSSLTALQQLVWPHGRPPVTPFEYTVGFLTLTWLQPGLVFLAGLAFYRDRHGRFDDS